MKELTIIVIAGLSILAIVWVTVRPVESHQVNQIPMSGENRK